MSPPEPFLRSTRGGLAPATELTPMVIELVDVVSAEGRILWANAAQHAALGWPEDALIATDLDRAYSAASVARIEAVFRRDPAAGQIPPLELNLLHADGRAVRTLAKATLALDGRSLTLSKQELGALGARLERLERDNQLLRRFADAGNEAHWCIEFGEPIDISLPTDEIVHRVFTHPSYWRLCNQAMARLYGLPQHLDLSTQSVRLHWPRSVENESFVRQIIASGYAIDGALSVDYRLDGSMLRVENDVRADIEGGMLIRLWGNCRPLPPDSGSGVVP